MKNISFILLAALLVSQTVVQSQVLDIVGPLTKTAFGCLASQGYHVAIVRAYSLNNGGSIDPNAVQTLVNAKSAGFIPFIYINLCRNGDAASQINTVLSSISSSLYRGKWIKVQQNTVAGC
jgi:K+ transporter